MGQRHQQFLRVVNPKKFSWNKKSFSLFDARKSSVILPFHNQWLFGRAALLLALNVLEHSIKIPKDEKTKSKMGGNYSSPFSASGFTSRFNDFDKYINSVSALINLIREENDAVPVGFHGSWMLSDKEEYDIMSKDFTMGDNNDGITLIDTIENTYCFMNISNYDGDWGASKLPSMVPLTAYEYVTAYYPEEYNKLGEYAREQLLERMVKAYKEGGESVEYDTFRDEFIKKEMDEQKAINKKYVDRFKPFKVMSVNHVKKLFPNVYVDADKTKA